MSLDITLESSAHLVSLYFLILIIIFHFLRAFSRAHLEAEGTYQCMLTDLVFDASEEVLVRYSVLSWSKFNKFVQEPWRIAGPIFNVQTVDKDPSALKIMQLPHSLCLEGEKICCLLYSTAWKFGHNPGRHRLIQCVSSIFMTEIIRPSWSNIC